MSIKINVFSVVHERTDERIGMYSILDHAESHCAEYNADYPAGNGPWMVIEEEEECEYKH
jgi:hypothetical protein